MFSSTEIRNAVLGCVDTSVDDDSENKSSTRHTAPAWTRLTSQAVPPAAEDVAELAGYVFLLAVVPRPRSTSASSSFTAISEWLTELFSPKPTKIHVALLSLIGSESRCCPYSTYVCIGAGWDLYASSRIRIWWRTTCRGRTLGVGERLRLQRQRQRLRRLRRTVKRASLRRTPRHVCSVPPFRGPDEIPERRLQSASALCGLAARILSRTFGF